MADYPFRVNIRAKNGIDEVAFMTASLVTDASALVSASIMVEKINLMPSASYEDGVVSGSSIQFVHKFGGNRNKYVSCSISDDANIGAINFVDTETTDNGGLDNYTFYGTKVCSVLGLPEGIPIFTENFKLSDSSTDPDNYISGKVISDAISIKDSLKMSPQSRLRSNLTWDEEFGEGLLQWVSGSSSQLRIGYDNVDDKYVMTGPITIDGSPLIAASEVQTTFLNGQSGNVVVRSGTLELLAGNRSSFDADENEAQIQMDTNANINIRGQMLIRHDESSTWSNSRTTTDYTMILSNRHGDAVGDFAGIAFDVGTNDFGSGNNAFSAAIIVERDNATTDLHDGNLSFATNDAAASGLTKRMTITHDGGVALAAMAAGVDNSVVIYDSDGVLKTDEIDSRVWGTTLLDGSNGSNNEIAVFTDSNSVEGVTTLTYDNQTLSVGVGDSLPRLFLDSTSSGDTWTAQGAHISLGETAGENASLSLTYTGDGYGRIGMGDITNGVPDNGEIRFTYNTDLIEIPSANVEIHNALSIGHTGTPASTLDVRSSSDTYMGIFRNTTTSDSGDSHILNLWHSQEDSTADFDATEHWIVFSDNSGTVLGEITGEVTYTTFTGGHVSQIISGSATDNENEMKAWKPGMILKSTGNLNVTGSSMGLAWSEVTVTTTEKDKAVAGVYNDIKPGSGSNWVGVYNNKSAVSSSTGDWGIGHNMHGLDAIKPAVDYNALGEGMMLVTDTNGNIETGDYICSSDRRGHGQKQDDDLLHNYTVAKATQPMDFSTVSVDSDLGYKSVLVACTYHCG